MRRSRTPALCLACALLASSCAHCIRPSLGSRLQQHERNGAFIGWSEHGHTGQQGASSSSTSSTSSASSTSSSSSNSNSAVGTPPVAAGTISGATANNNGSAQLGLLDMATNQGQIRIRLRPDLSPRIVRMVVQLAQSGQCQSCHFYRHEPAPENFGRNGFYGPPYALLQGSLADLPEDPPFEAAPPIKRGNVAMIPRCKEFFIATADHVEWGSAHTVWGEVADDASWQVINSVAYEPYTNRTDSYNITTRWLEPKAHLRFRLFMLPAAAA